MEDRRRAFFRIFLPLIFVSCAAAQSNPSRNADNPPLEYEIKAAFLLNFTKFVEWPAPAAADPASPLTVCILGPDPFGAALEQIVEGESVNGRKIVVRKLRAPEPNACSIVYFAQTEKSSPAQMEHDVLTVGEGSEFLRQGGMIAFVIDHRRVRFDVNRRATERAGLTISSQLLKVARSVEQ